VAPLPKPHLKDLLLEPLTGHTHDDLVLAAVKIASAQAGYAIKLSDEEILNHPGRWAFDAAVEAGTDPATYATLGEAALARAPAVLRALRMLGSAEHLGALEKTAAAGDRALLVGTEGAAPSGRSLGYARRIAKQADVEILPYADRGLFVREGQAHHLNPTEILGGDVRYEDGITTPLAGDAFGDVDSEHFLAHRGREAFFDMYRPETTPPAKYPVSEGPLYPGRPTFSQCNRALYNTLQEAGVSADNALRMVMEAKAEQLRAGFRGANLPLDLPRRMGQRGGP